MKFRLLLFISILLILGGNCNSCTSEEEKYPNFLISKIEENNYNLDLDQISQGNWKVIRMVVENNFLIIKSANAENKNVKYSVIDIGDERLLFEKKSPINNNALETFTFSQDKLYCCDITDTILYSIGAADSNWGKQSVPIAYQMFMTTMFIRNDIVFYKGNMFGIAIQSLTDLKGIHLIDKMSANSKFNTYSMPYDNNVNMVLGHIIYDSLKHYVYGIKNGTEILWKGEFEYNKEYNIHDFSLQETITSIKKDSFFVTSCYNYLECRKVNNGEIIWKQEFENRISRIFSCKYRIYLFFRTKKGYDLYELPNLHEESIKKRYSIESQERVEIYSVGDFIYIVDGYNLIKLEINENEMVETSSEELSEKGYDKLEFITDYYSGKDYYFR